MRPQKARYIAYKQKPVSNFWIGLAAWLLSVLLVLWHFLLFEGKGCYCIVVMNIEVRYFIKRLNAYLQYQYIRIREIEVFRFSRKEVFSVPLPAERVNKFSEAGQTNYNKRINYLYILTLRKNTRLLRN